jgi:flagellar biosynthetic protein FliQ
MTIDHAVELARAAIFLTLLLGAPVMLVSMVVGLAISIIQAVTQIQEQTLSFVPKIMVMLLATLITLPWAIGQLVEYSTTLFRNIPSSL